MHQQLIALFHYFHHLFQAAEVKPGATPWV